MASNDVLSQAEQDKSDFAAIVNSLTSPAVYAFIRHQHRVTGPNAGLIQGQPKIYGDNWRTANPDDLFSRLLQNLREAKANPSPAAWGKCVALIAMLSHRSIDDRARIMQAPDFAFMRFNAVEQEKFRSLAKSIEIDERLTEEEGAYLRSLLTRVGSAMGLPVETNEALVVIENHNPNEPVSNPRETRVSSDLLPPTSTGGTPVVRDKSSGVKTVPPGTPGGTGQGTRGNKSPASQG